MKIVRFLVEGKKDVCFLRALFSVRFPCLRYEGEPEGSKEGALFYSKTYSVEVVPVGGYTKLGNVKSSAEDKMGVGLRVALIFDADVTGAEHGGVAARTKFLNGVVSAWKNEAPPSDPIEMFLLPDNSRDGELEDLLEDIVPQRFHPFIAECWRRYEQCLEVHGGERPSQKSKMNDYEAAVLGPVVWEYGGINKGLMNTDIWDWHSSKLSPLVEFIANQLSFSGGDTAAQLT